MNRQSFFPRFLSGLIELQDIHHVNNSFYSGNLIPYGDHQQSVGVIDKPFTSVYGSDIYNRNGKLEVNRLTGRDPIKTTLVDGIGDVSLMYDGSLQVVDGALSVKPTITMNSDFDL